MDISRVKISPYPKPGMLARAGQAVGNGLIKARNWMLDVRPGDPPCFVAGIGMGGKIKPPDLLPELQRRGLLLSVFFDFLLFTRELGCSESSALFNIAEVLVHAGIIDAALKVTRKIKSSYGKSVLLSKISRSLARAGNFEKALEISGEIEGDYEKYDALKAVIKSLLHAGKVKKAMDVSEKILEAFRKTKYFDDESWLRRIANVLALAGNLKKALELTRRINDRGWWGHAALDEAADDLARLGYFEEAIIVAGTIKDVYSRSIRLREITKALVLAGNFEKALKVTRKIKDTQLRSITLEDIGITLARARKFEKAKKVFRRALRIEKKDGVFGDYYLFTSLIRTLDERTNASVRANALIVAKEIEHSRDPSLALENIAKDLARMGMIEEALKAAGKIKDSYPKSSVLEEIAKALVKMGDVEKALEVAREVKDEGPMDFKSGLLEKIAKALARAGNLEKALEVAGEIDNCWCKSAALDKIAKTLVRVGNNKKALEVAREIDPGLDRHRASVLEEIAKALARKGMTEETLGVFGEIKDLDRRFGGIESSLDALGKIAKVIVQIDSINESEVLSYVGIALVQAGMTDISLTVAMEIKSFWIKARLLADIAAIMRKQRRLEKAVEVLNLALTLAGKDTNFYRQAATLSYIEQAMAQGGRRDDG